LREVLDHGEGNGAHLVDGIPHLQGLALDFCGWERVKVVVIELVLEKGTEERE